MFFGLFESKAKKVTVKRKKIKEKKTVGIKAKKSKIRKAKTVKRPAKLKKKRPAIKKASRAPKVMPQVAGKVTHYFPHVKAGVILITDGTIAPGDILHIKGHTTDFKQKVGSMQINNVPIKQAKAGQEIGVLLKFRVRHNDIVYKI